MVPFFGVEGAAGLGFNVLGLFGVDQATAKVCYLGAGTTGYQLLPDPGDPTGAHVVYDTWNSFEMKLDYSTFMATLTYTPSGGSPLPSHTVPFVDGPLDDFHRG